MCVSACGQCKISSGQSGSVQFGGPSAAGVILCMTRLLSVFHLQVFFTSGDSWKKMKETGRRKWSEDRVVGT